MHDRRDAGDTVSRASRGLRIRTVDPEPSFTGDRPQTSGQGGAFIKQLMKDTGLSKATIYRYLDQNAAP